MLKRRDSPYVAGRPKGLWYKWKRDPHLVDAVLMYAQRGHGKRSSFYSDFTFGVWADDDALVPVGKAYFGFTDAELVELDKWVRNNTVNPLRPGARGPRRSRAGNRLRRPGPVEPAQIGRRHALSPYQPHPLGQAAGRGGPAGSAEPAAATIVHAGLRAPSSNLARSSAGIGLPIR